MWILKRAVKACAGNKDEGSRHVSVCVSSQNRIKKARSRNWASQVALVVKNLPPSAGDIRNAGSIPALGRSPGEGMKTHSSILA